MVIVASAAHYIFDRYELIEEPSIAWALMCIGAIASFLYGRKQGKSVKVSHYTDKLYAWLWLSLGIGMVVIVINGHYLNFQIVPLILMLAGVGTFVSGVMMRFKALQFGAVCLWVISIFAFQLNEVEQLLAMSVGIALGYLLPGYLMKSKNRK